MDATLFISHASEDKEKFVRPLAHALKARGIPLWYDEFSLRPGDSLRQSIDMGLAACKGGLVVLSPHFFAKQWPQRELDALFTAEMVGRAKLIPIWHQIGLKELAAVSPLLADRFALQSDIGVEAMADKLAELFPVSPTISGASIADRLEAVTEYRLFANEAASRGCQYRFLTLNAFKVEYSELVDGELDKLSDEDSELVSNDVIDVLERAKERLISKFGIPNGVYLTSDESVQEENFGWWMESIGDWASGTLSPEESANLVRNLDVAELDEYFILLGIPNFSISGEQRSLLELALPAVGCGFESGYVEVESICRQLRDL